MPTNVKPLGPSGGGGGTNFLHPITPVVLTNTQIKALPSLARDIVPAPGANLIAIPAIITVAVDTSAGAYTVDAGASWILQWVGGNYIGGPLAMGIMLGNAAVTFNLLGPFPLLKPNAANFSNIVSGTASVSAIADIANQSLQIKDDWNGVSDYTDGHTNNTATIGGAYYVYNVTTGLFVPVS